jgi:hypothetical protein
VKPLGRIATVGGRRRGDEDGDHAVNLDARLPIATSPARLYAMSIERRPVTSMTQKPRSEYLSMRREFEPTSERVKLVIVAESPPIGGKYFYNTSGEVTEPLFRALMRELGHITLKTKSEGLRKFKQRGWVLVDATYEQVNALDSPTRDRAILRDYSQLCDDLKQLLSTRWKKVPLVLIKANVCRLLEPLLKADGFNVLNPRGHIVPFPSHGHQSKFGVKLPRCRR